MLGERGKAIESEKKVEVGWEREKDTKRERSTGWVTEIKIDRETGSGVGERESEQNIEKRIERVTWWERE